MSTLAAIQIRRAVVDRHVNLRGAKIATTAGRARFMVTDPASSSVQESA
jgi:hypothetical protein